MIECLMTPLQESYISYWVSNNRIGMEDLEGRKGMFYLTMH